MPPMLKDDDIGSDSDGENFEAVTPEHYVGNLDGDTTLTSTIEKRSHILEDVDGELEMEDVAPSCEVEITSTSNIVETDCTKMSHHQWGNHYGALVSPQQAEDTQLMSAPLPRSPPPPPPPPPHQLLPSVFSPARLHSVSNGPDSKLYWSSQEPRGEQSHLPRIKSRTFDAVHLHSHDNKVSQAQLLSKMPDSSNACQSTSQLSGQVSYGFQPVDGAFSEGYHLSPPHPAPSSQFLYVLEQHIQSRRDNPPPSHSNRRRNAENGNFYRDRGRHKFAPCDNIGEYWRPPWPSISGPCIMKLPGWTPMAYSGPSHEPALHNNRWKYPPRSMSHRQFNPYKPSSEGPIPVSNRGPNYWKMR